MIYVGQMKGPAAWAGGWLPQGSVKPVEREIPRIVQHLTAGGWWQHMYSSWWLLAVVTSLTGHLVVVLAVSMYQNTAAIYDLKS